MTKDMYCRKYFQFSRCMNNTVLFASRKHQQGLSEVAFAAAGIYWAVAINPDEAASKMHYDMAVAIAEVLIRNNYINADLYDFTMKWFDFLVKGFDEVERI